MGKSLIVDLDDNNIVLASSWVDYNLQGNYNERRTSSFLDVYMRNKHMHQLNKKKLVFHCKTKEEKLKLITINEIDQVTKSPNQLVKIESDRKRELGVMIDWES